MLYSAFTFLLVAALAAILGFLVLAGTAATVFQVIFYVALGLFVISALVGVVQGRRISRA